MFYNYSVVEDLYDFIWVNQNQNSSFYLVNGSSKEQLLDVSIPIASIADEDHYVNVFVTDQ